MAEVPDGVSDFVPVQDVVPFEGERRGLELRRTVDAAAFAGEQLQEERVGTAVVVAESSEDIPDGGQVGEGHVRGSPARRTESGEHASLHRIHRPCTGAVGDELLASVGRHLGRVDAFPLEPAPQLLEGDGHFHQTAVGVGFRLFADARTGEYDLDLLAVELLQHLGVGDHG